MLRQAKQSGDIPFPLRLGRNAQPAAAKPHGLGGQQNIFGAGGAVLLVEMRSGLFLGIAADPVTQEQVEKLLEAGIMAPSAMNKQPWHFIVCRDREMLDRFQQVHPYSKMLSQAPVMILVCGDTQRQPGPHFYQPV